MIRRVPYDELKSAICETVDANIRLSHAMHQKKGEQAIREATEGLWSMLGRLHELRDQLALEEYCGQDEVRPEEQ